MLEIRFNSDTLDSGCPLFLLGVPAHLFQAVAQPAQRWCPRPAVEAESLPCFPRGIYLHLGPVTISLYPAHRGVYRGVFGFSCGHYAQVAITTFNIHVSCPGNALIEDFIYLIDSFDLAQSAAGPTHKHGHTLDLVLSIGLPVFNVNITDAVFSDHMPILFDILQECDVLSD